MFVQANRGSTSSVCKTTVAKAPSALDHRVKLVLPSALTSCIHVVRGGRPLPSPVR